MKQLSLFFKDFLENLRGQKKLYAIAFLTLTVSLFCAYVLSGILPLYVTDVQYKLDMKKKYLLDSPAGSSQGFAMFEYLAQNDRLPPLRSVHLQVRLSAEDARPFDQRLLAYPVFPRQWEHLNHQAPDALQGRFFTQEELTAGAPVIVLNERYADGAALGSVITLGDIPFTLIGIVPNSSDPGNGYIPYKALRKQPAEESGFYLSLGLPGFAKELTQQQKDMILSDIQPYYVSSGAMPPRGIPSVYDGRSGSDLMMYLFFVILIFFVFLLCALNIVGIFKYLAIQNQYRFAIYKTCGCQTRQILCFLYGQMALLACGAFGFSLLLASLTQSAQERLLGVKTSPLAVYPLLLLGFLPVFFFSILPAARRVARLSPVQQKLWR